MNCSDFITGPPATSTVAEHTLYARDANGEVMAIYKGSNTEANRYNMTCSEWYIYGSKSHGRFARSQEPPYNTTMPVYDPALLYNAGSPPIHTRRLKYKDYEIKDHLGNVTTLFSDLKLPAGTLGTYFKIDLMEANNFYPFGMSESGLHYTAPSFNYRYSYNGKEKDDAIKGEGNSYDYGARFFDPRLGRFLSLDPFFEKYPSSSSYCYALNTPIQAKDPDGKKVLFVNGYYNSGYGIIPKWFAENFIGTVGGKGYWHEKFVSVALNFFKDKKFDFVDGRGSFTSTGSERFEAGYAYAKANLSSITSRMVDGESIKIVSQSQGCAFSEGIIKCLEENKIPVSKVVHLSAADPSEFTASTKPFTLQLNIENDPIVFVKNLGENNMIQGVDRFGQAKTNRNFIQDLRSSHGDTKLDASTFSMLEDMQNIKLQQIDNTLYTPFGSFSGSSNIYQSFGNNNGTQFNILNINGTEYNGTSTNNEYKGPIQ